MKHRLWSVRTVHDDLAYLVNIHESIESTSIMVRGDLSTIWTSWSFG